MARTNHQRGGGDLFQRLHGAVTRRAVLKGSGLVGLGTLTASLPALRSAAQETPSVQAALKSAITMEAFAVTLLGVARDRGRRLALDDADIRFLRAAQCEDEAHYHFFAAAGAAPTTTTFAIANATFADRETFFRAFLRVQTIFVGGYMAAARQFAAQGDLRLVEVAYQIGAIEAQHQALANVLLGERLPNDRAFAEWRFREIGEAVAALAEAGYIDGPGKKYDYPGPVDRFCRGVFGLVAETTDDQEPLPQQSATPAPNEATPAATPSI